MATSSAEIEHKVMAFFHFWTYLAQRTTSKIEIWGGYIDNLFVITKLSFILPQIQYFMRG